MKEIILVEFSNFYNAVDEKAMQTNSGLDLWNTGRGQYNHCIELTNYLVLLACSKPMKMKIKCEKNFINM